MSCRETGIIYSISTNLNGVTCLRSSLWSREGLLQAAAGSSQPYTALCQERGMAMGKHVDTLLVGSGQARLSVSSNYGV